MSLPSDIITQLQNFSTQTTSKLLTLLQTLQVPQIESDAINEQLQNLIINTFKKLLNEQKVDNICNLLDIIWQSLTNSSIKKTTLITLLDGVLQCISLKDLKGVLRVISDRITQMRDTMADVSHHLLRVVNTLVKRISKTTDYQIRGELMLAITKILTLCHNSGFQYRANSTITNQKIDIQDGLFDNFNQSKISNQFYNDFWEIQKYLMNLQELSRDQRVGSSKDDPNLIPIRLRKIQSIIDNILTYFKLNPPTQHKHYSNFPIKFLKLSNLLALQIQDSYFRILILIQVVFFCSSFDLFPAKQKIKLNHESTETINRIKKKVNVQLTAALETRNDLQGTQSFIDSLIKNQAYWINLKDNWRQIKKNFFKSGADEQPQNTNDSNKKQGNQNIPIQPAGAVPPAQPQQSVKQEKKYTIAQITKKTQKQIRTKMDIKANFIEHFLSQTSSPVLKKEPISPSFAHYYSQAKLCLQNFSQQDQCQTEFQTRSQYNVFEWKAFRSLIRERIVTGIESQKSGNKYSEYKLLDFVSRKQQIFEGEPRKKVKLDESNGFQLS